ILGTRDRGCSAHPAFPAPSLQERDNEIAKLGQNMPRDQFLSSLRTQGPIRRGGSDLEKWSTTLLNQLNPVVMGPCVRRDDTEREAPPRQSWPGAVTRRPTRGRLAGSPVSFLPQHAQIALPSRIAIPVPLCSRYR